MAILFSCLCLLFANLNTFVFLTSNKSSLAYFGIYNGQLSFNSGKNAGPLIYIGLMIYMRFDTSKNFRSDQFINTASIEVFSFALKRTTKNGYVVKKYKSLGNLEVSKIFEDFEIPEDSLLLSAYKDQVTPNDTPNGYPLYLGALTFPDHANSELPTFQNLNFITAEGFAEIEKGLPIFRYEYKVIRNLTLLTRVLRKTPKGDGFILDLSSERDLKYEFTSQFALDLKFEIGRKTNPGEGDPSKNYFFAPHSLKLPKPTPLWHKSTYCADGCELEWPQFSQKLNFLRAQAKRPNPIFKLFNSDITSLGDVTTHAPDETVTLLDKNTYDYLSKIQPHKGSSKPSQFKNSLENFLQNKANGGRETNYIKLKHKDKSTFYIFAFYNLVNLNFLPDIPTASNSPSDAEVGDDDLSLYLGDDLTDPQLNFSEPSNSSPALPPRNLPSNLKKENNFLGPQNPDNIYSSINSLQLDDVEDDNPLNSNFNKNNDSVIDDNNVIIEDENDEERPQIIFLNEGSKKSEKIENKKTFWKNLKKNLKKNWWVLLIFGGIILLVLVILIFVLSRIKKRKRRKRKERFCERVLTNSDMGIVRDEENLREELEEI